MHGSPAPSNSARTRWLPGALALALAACSPQESLPGADQDPDTGTIVDSAGGKIGDAGGGFVDPQEDTYVPFDAGPGWSYGTCGALYGCVQAACGGEASGGCDKPCLDKSSDDAQEHYTNYGKCLSEACIAKVCKGSDDDKCVSKCAGQRCGGVLLQCLGSGKTGGNGCANTYIADKACASSSDRFKCLTDAFGSLSKKAQDDYITMQLCLAGSLDKDPWGDCMTEVMVCSSSAKIGPSPCRDVLACETDCAKASHLYACLGKCYGKGTTAAQKQYLAVKSCLRSAESGKAKDGACYQAVAACAEPDGKATCEATWACANTCKAKTGKQEVYCVGECLHDATPAAATALAAWWGCREAVCKPKCGKDKKCLEGCYSSTCGALGKACFGG